MAEGQLALVPDIFVNNPNFDSDMVGNSGLQSAPRPTHPFVYLGGRILLLKRTQ